MRYILYFLVLIPGSWFLVHYLSFCSSSKITPLIFVEASTSRQLERALQVSYPPSLWCSGVGKQPLQPLAREVVKVVLKGLFALISRPISTNISQGAAAIASSPTLKA
ncbi:hypothetical protein FGO68_gene12629 [Halteria grandinella]|uniref:Uncharacterized protein n=1 Tax=Halteria grandinella TaxID=5974 RepID=A0A8J8SU53_HALGN|nr:hypothetical protein FGO68_gene12629 [Halteria grandinella]